jgi:hypothetical protein
VVGIIPVIGIGINSVPAHMGKPVIYPNPVEKEFCISGLTSSGTITIFDQSGKLVLTEMVDVASQCVVVFHLLPGSYLYKLETAGLPCRTGVLVRMAGQ